MRYSFAKMEVSAVAFRWLNASRIIIGYNPQVGPLYGPGRGTIAFHRRHED